MDWTQVIWDESPGGNAEHVEEHDLTTDEVDYVLENYESKSISRSSELPCVFGHTPDGRYVTVIVEVEDDTVIPVTAYEVDETVNRENKMAKQKLKHVNRRLTEEERARHARIRIAAQKENPPKAGRTRKASPPGIPTKIRQAREAQGLTWYALARRAAIPNQATIRDIEQGRDVKLSNLRAVAIALGLELELVEATT